MPNIKTATSLTLLGTLLLCVGMPLLGAEKVDPSSVEKHTNLQPMKGLDRYFGSLQHKSRATGFFRVEKIDAIWWFITPEGHPFFSTGVNSTNFNGSGTKEGKHHYRTVTQKKYGSPEVWADAQTDRLRRWGWNTIGAWSQWKLFRTTTPYTIILKLGSRDWKSKPAADLFSPEYRVWVRQELEMKAKPVANDPYLIGYFIDNEMKWGPDHRGGDLFDLFFKKSAETNHSKRELIAFLEDRYQTLDALRKDFKVPASVANWSDLAAVETLPSRLTTTAAETKRDWTVKVAERFLKVTDEELRRVDPNHLNLGVRFISQMVPPSVIRIAGKYVDVMSINFYEIKPFYLDIIATMSKDYLPIDDLLAAHYREGGRPILISEWGYRAADSGLPNSWPPIYPTLATQKDRADAYERQFRKMLQKNYILGQHWFKHVDQPPEGRFDGENCNFGLVNEKDEPYRELTDRSQVMANEPYRRLKGKK